MDTWRFTYFLKVYCKLPYEYLQENVLIQMNISHMGVPHGRATLMEQCTNVNIYCMCSNYKSEKI